MAIISCFFLGCLGRFKFLIRFFQCLLDQSDDKILLTELLAVGLLIPHQIFLDPLEEFLTYLECHCSHFAHTVCSLHVMFVDDHFDEFAHRAFTFTDVLADPIVQVQRDFTGDALGFHVIASFFSRSFRATQAYPKAMHKAIHQDQQSFSSTNIITNNA